MMHTDSSRGRGARATKLRRLELVLLVLMLTAGAGWAQQPTDQPANQQPSQPESPAAPALPQGNPAGTQAQPASPAAGQGEQGGAAGGAAAPVDTRPLAGAQLITPQLPGGGRSFILPNFSVWEGADSNSQLVPGTRQFEWATVPVAAVTLNRQGRHNQFGLSYGGGALIYDSDLNHTATFQDFGIQDSYAGRRWSVFVEDRATYLPQPITGFAGIGFAGAFSNFQSLGLGQSVSALSPGFEPEQSVLSGQYGVTANTAVAQVQYSFTPRTSVSAVGDIGYQHFSQAGLLSGSSALMVLSADHMLSPTDTVSFSYSFSAYRFNGGNVAINNNLWRVGYGHRISERFTISLLAGPELTYSAIRQVPGVQERVTWAGQAVIGYAQPRTVVNLTYLHYLSPGSGVFQGAQTDSVSGSLSRELTRSWSGTMSLGYSKNSALASYSLNPNFPAPGNIGYEFGSLRINHTLSRNLQAFGVYELERQESGQVFIPFGSGRLILRHVFGIGVEIHPRPIGL